MSRTATSVKRSVTFVERCLAGEADLGEIDAAVQGWHDSNDARPLHDVLGLTWLEYQVWVERPAALPFILASRKYNVPLEQVLRPADDMAAAARAENPAEAASVLAWLKQTRRI
jgi:hypothetical protein